MYLVYNQLSLTLFHYIKIIVVFIFLRSTAYSINISLMLLVKDAMINF